MLGGSKKNVFLVVCVPGQAVEILEIAKTLKSSDEFFPIIYFNLGHVQLTPLMSDILAMGIDIFDYNMGYISSAPPEPLVAAQNSVPTATDVAVPLSKTAALKKRIRNDHPVLFSVVKWVVGTYYGFRSLFLRRFSFIQYVLRKIERAKRESQYFKKYDVRLLILAEDSEGYFTPQMVQVAQKHGAKVVVFPYTFANQFEFLEDAFINDRIAGRSFATYAAAKLFPKWARNYRHKDLLRWNPDLIFGAELIGPSTPNPWVMNSGAADVIAVESQFMQSYYEQAGIPSAQMLETGFISLDQLSEAVKNRQAIKAEISQRFRLDLGKPWLVCAVPPSQWPHAGVGFSSYEEFLNEFIGFLKSFSDIEIILKFHPRLTRDEVRQMCDRYNLPNIEQGTAQLIGIADFYLATVSATIRWALACGLPTINYDLYAYRYDDFKKAPGLHSAERFADFQHVFNSVCEDVVKAFAKKQTPTQNAEYGQLDGQSSARILQLFRRLLASS